MKYHSAVSLSVSPAKPSRPLLRLHTTRMAASPEPGQPGTPQPAAAETGSDSHELLASGRPLPQPILGAVVDLDGTLLDSEPIYFQCYKHAAGSFGVEYELERDHAQIIGRPEVAGAETLIAHLKLEGVTPEQFLKARDEKFKELIGDVQALPGAVQLLRWLKEELHLPVAVATSSSREYLPLKQAKNAELFSFVDAVVCGDDDVVGAGKPAPDIFLAGAKALHLPPTSCISVEDAISGVKAATSAGMWTACVPHPSVPVQQYVEAGADLLSPGGLLPVLGWLKTALEAQVKTSGGQGE